MIFDRLSVIERNVQAVTGSPRTKKVRPYLLQMSGWLPVKYANRRNPRLEKKKTPAAVTPAKSDGAAWNFWRPMRQSIFLLMVILTIIRAAARQLHRTARLVETISLFQSRIRRCDEKVVTAGLAAVYSAR